VEESLSQLLNAHGVSDVRQTEIPTAEPLVTKVETATEKLKDTNHHTLIQFQQN